MQAIAAANDLRIEFDADSWRLVSHELPTETTLVEATPEGLVTHPVFRAARALSSSTIVPAQIARVMLGWAPENAAWRLGLLITDGLGSVMDTTQMQWCELAAWPKQTIAPDTEELRYAGQMLARLLNRPFQFVQPSSTSRVAVFAAPVEDDNAPDTPDQKDDTPQSRPKPARPRAWQLAPEIETAALPIRINDWRLVGQATGARWERLRRWWLLNIGRLLLVFALGVLFLVLSVGSLTRGLAAVEPTWLPNVGIAIGVVLVLALLQLIWQLLNTQAVAVDSYQREVYEQGVLVPFVNWRVGFDAVEYVLVTQNKPNPQGRRQPTDPMNIAQDVWIHVYDGQRFYEVIALDGVEGRSWDWETVRTHHRTQVRRGLQLAQYDTPVHHAARQIADIIGVPVYLDLI